MEKSMNMTVSAPQTQQVTPRRLSYGEVERLNRTIRQYEIYYANLSGNIGSEQGGLRPVLVIQNDVGNKYAPTTIIAPITSRSKGKLPTHLYICEGECGLTKDSTVLFEQLRTVDKRRLGDYVGTLTHDLVEQAREKILVSFG